MSTGVKLIPILPKTKPPVLDASKLDKEMERILKLVILEFQSIISKYPSQAGGVNYRRTGTYGRGWTNASIKSSPKEVIITNVVKYATYVGGPNQTSIMARYGWPNTQKAAEQAIAKVRASGKLKLDIT